MSEVIEKRLNSLKEQLDNNYEAFVLTSDANVGYFSGFLHSEGTLVVTKSSNYLFVDFRYFESAQKQAKCCKVICYRKLTFDILDVLRSERILNLWFEASNITIFRFEAFKSFFEDACISSYANIKLDEVISDIRSIKDETEISKIQTAQKIAEKAYLEMLNDVKVGAKESDLSARLEYLMKRYGAQGASFDLITITGKKTSLPHGVPSDSKIKKGDFFTCDFGAVYDGYCSDTTRTVAVGFATEEMKKVYSVVLKAQLAALDAVKSGEKCLEIDKIARDIITENGYGEFFGHATGHGVGLEIHEAPTISPRCETILKSGMIITDEPGIYLPNRFGVRIEDMLCVTDNGCKNFVNLPKQLVIV